MFCDEFLEVTYFQQAKRSDFKPQQTDVYLNNIQKHELI